jgi:hypothetical protein
MTLMESICSALQPSKLIKWLIDPSFKVFGSICSALQPSKLLNNLEEKSAKGLFLGIDPACYKVLDLQSKVASVSRTVKVFDDKFLSTEENEIHCLCLEEEPTHPNFLDPTPARLEDSRDSPQGPRERKSTADLTHARMRQLQELRLATTVTSTLDHKSKPQVFAKASKSEALMDSMRKNSQPLLAASNLSGSFHCHSSSFQKDLEVHKEIFPLFFLSESRLLIHT